MQYKFVVIFIAIIQLKKIKPEDGKNYDYN